MLIFIFSVIVYTFFVYGVIEFIKKLYWDILNKKGILSDRKLMILVDEEDKLEYTIRLLKRDFNYICIVDTKYRKEIENIVQKLSDDAYVEYMTLEEIRRRNSS